MCTFTWDLRFFIPRKLNKTWRWNLHQSTSLAELQKEASRSSRLQTLGNQLINCSPYIRYASHKYYLWYSIPWKMLMSLKWTCVQYRLGRIFLQNNTLLWQTASGNCLFLYMRKANWKLPNTALLKWQVNTPKRTRKVPRCNLAVEDMAQTYNSKHPLWEVNHQLITLVAGVPFKGSCHMWGINSIPSLSVTIPAWHHRCYKCARTQWLLYQCSPHSFLWWAKIIVQFFLLNAYVPVLVCQTFG